MRKILLTAVALLSSVVISATAQVAAPTLYGNLIYSSAWGSSDGDKAGIYKFTADATGDVSLEYKPAGGYIYANGGAVYVDGKYYVLAHEPKTGAVKTNVLYTYDADTWTLLDKKDAPLGTSANDLTWCPVDNKVYGVFMNSTSSGYVFGTLDLADGSVDVIKALDLSDNLGPMPMMALASSAEGDIYGVGADGNLYSFDRTGGDHTLIGATGFLPARWNQSACFDFTDKKMYWAACNADVSALFTVDTTTGAATRVRTFANDEEFVGLYSLSGIADVKGPQALADFTVELQGASLSGKVSFEMPAKTIAGDNLVGDVNYTVEDNGTVLLEGKAAAGSAVSRDVTFAEGAHTLVAYASTDQGRGASVRASVYAGKDAPAAPAAVTAVKDGQTVKISWEAVTDGAHNGYLDGAVTYTVTRQPDGKTVATGLTATSCTDSELPAALGDYTYNVCAVAGGVSGAPTASAPLSLGSAYETPMNMDLTKEDQFKLCTVIDANKDGKTWEYSANGSMCRYNSKNESDDWLITPMINLQAGKQYTLTLEMRSGNSRTAETYEVKAGHAAAVDAMTVTVVEPTSLKVNTRAPYPVIFVPEADGAYCFGIHCTSPKNGYSLYVYSISVSEGVSTGAPVASESVTATAAANGALEATVVAKAPEKAVDGTAITTLVKAELVNLTTEAIVGTVDNPTPGAEVTFTDKNAVNGINEYSVAFYNAAGKGCAATASVYVGEDTPVAPSDVVVKQIDGKAVISWTALAEGANGGYVNPANLKYRVVNVSNKSDIATGVTECTCTDGSLSTDEQQIIQYTVYASNVAGEGIGTNSNVLTFGDAYPAPFAESFAGGKESMTPWAAEVEGKGYQSWTPSTNTIYDETDRSQDGDAGWIKYSSKGTVTLLSPIIDVTTLSKPALKFWYMAVDGATYDLAFDVAVSGDRGVTRTNKFSVNVTAEEWTPVTIDLADFKNSKELQICFKASTQSYQDMAIDNIKIYDPCNIDLGILTFTGPATLDAGSTGKYSVKLANNGAAGVAAYTIEVYGNDRLLASAQGEAIAPDAFATVDIDVPVPVNFGETVLTAKVVVSGDENAANDEATFAISATRPRFPVIETLSAVSEGAGIKLSWARPAEQRNPSAITDDFESLTPWDFGGVTATEHTGTIGDYTVYDADGVATVVAASYMTQPNGGKPMAYQVNKTGNPYPDVDLTTYNINAHSGSQSLIAWGSADGASSDWLILPELFAGETTISFWAHATPMDWGTSPSEKMEILYSTTTSDIDQFQSFGGTFDVPYGSRYDDEAGFHQFVFTLPADAKYVAIRSSLSTQMNKSIVLDDLCYTPASLPVETLEIKGYNIYRDGEKIGTAQAEEYLDTTATGSHVYNVTTTYHLGESPFSNDADAAVSGIENVVSGADGELRFFNLQGFEVKNPEPGHIYIVVRPDGTSSKALIR